MTSVPVPRYVCVTCEDAKESVVAATDDDNISGKEPIDDVILRTHTLSPVMDTSVLNADGGGYTDEEWATYLKIRKDKERHEREKEHDLLPLIEYNQVL